MSAQPTDQIGGSLPKSSVFRSLRGSFSQGSSGVVSAPTLPTPPIQPSIPVEPPVAEPVVVEEPPVELEEVAEESAALEPEAIPELAPLETPTPEVQMEEQPVVEETPTDSLSAAIPVAVDTLPDTSDTLNPPQAGSGLAKEAPLLSVTVEHPAIDQAGGVQYVENEPVPEMPPEVEGFLKKVEDNVDQIPQEIVIADLQTGQQMPRVLATPVIILPITPKTEDEGKKKSPEYSIRWLIEWSWKMMKVFSGKVVYRDEGPEE